MQKYDLSDTVAAIATAVGESGISIVRISGKDALGIADKIFLSPRNKKPSSTKTYTIHYGSIADEGNIIDEVILSIMKAPRSFTREDVVEINCHGGIVATRAVLELVLANGARMAEPGEFTKRAFINGRIDLAQAEAVLDIIRAKTDSALKIGVHQLKGGLSKEINKIRNLVLSELALLEANIDFPEEEIKSADLARVKEKLKAAQGQMKKMLEGAKRGKIMREGIHVVICGKPNAGKSSLLNALLKRERSIVTPVAGTTRDTIEEIIDIKGIPVRIVDTAGILEPRDLIERKALERSRKQIDLADMVILLFDGSKKIAKADQVLIKRVKSKNTLAIINKIDLKQKIELNKIKARFDYTVTISAKKSLNIDLLEQAIADQVYQGKCLKQEPVMISNLRHIGSLREAQKLIAQALNSLDNDLSLEFIAQDIKETLAHLDEISGKNFSTDMLDKIFSEFCIGK